MPTVPAMLYVGTMPSTSSPAEFRCTNCDDGGDLGLVLAFVALAIAVASLLVAIVQTALAAGRPPWRRPRPR